MSERAPTQPEPWLRGTHNDVEPIARGVLHALELAKEDLAKWCSPLSDDQLNSRPAGIAPVAFYLRHIAGSLDRLLTYAEGNELNDQQLSALQQEQESIARRELFADLEQALDRSVRRVLALAGQNFSAPRFVGKKKLPSTLGGLLVHVADHTQRHVGQAIVTTKLVTAAKPL